MAREYKTLLQWKQAHPHVNVLAFEANYDKVSGFGEFEEVCGFCLASHYFDDEPPKVCRFCRALLRETHVISDLPEITDRVYCVSTLSLVPTEEPRLVLIKGERGVELEEEP